MSRRFSAIGLAFLLATSAAATARPPQASPAARVATPFDPAGARQAIEKLATLIEENFVYPETGKAYAALLRANLASGKYARAASAEEFARVVTHDLQAVNADGHLRVEAPGSEIEGSTSAAAPGVVQNNGVGKAGWLAKGVAYMDIHGFSGDPAEIAKLRKTFDRFRTARVLIVDARSYLGGGFLETDVMFSYFFARPTRMMAFDVRSDVERRGGGMLEEGPTLRRVAGPRDVIRRVQYAVPKRGWTGLKTARILWLTSKRTISGGEHVALAMKRTHRATLIGETTAGAGHFGRKHDLGGGYRAFIPIGRPFNPDTNRGWEGTGVTPNIAVPASKALDTALRLARVPVRAAKRALASFQ